MRLPEARRDEVKLRVGRRTFAFLGTSVTLLVIDLVGSFRGDVCRQGSKMSATGATLVKADGSGDWLADIFDVMDGENIPGMEMAHELVLKDEVFDALEAQGEVGAVDVSKVDGGVSSDLSKKRGREEHNSSGRPENGSNGKMNKSQREKRRRDALNNHFMGLSGLLDPGSTVALKTDKATIVVEAARVIKQLRAQLQQKAESLHDVTATNETLTKARESILQDKHKLQHQLSCFMSSLPFASPLMGGLYQAHPGAPAATSMLKPGLASPLPGMMFAFPPLMVQTTTADEDAKLRAPVA